MYEDDRFLGFGAEIVAQIAEFAFEHLDGPIKRLAAKDVPIGFSPVLESATLPQTEDVVSALNDLLKY